VARPRSAGFDEQREQIFAAAALLFATRGYTASTMNELAVACGVSKATLYHYVQDKPDLLLQICVNHVARLEALVAAVQVLKLPPLAHLRELIQRFMQVYARAQNEHRVLTEDVKFLPTADSRKVLAGQRRVVAAFAAGLCVLRPALHDAKLAKPLAMLLFGMMNWTFTWWQADGALTHDGLADLVVALLTGGLPAVVVPTAAARRTAATTAARKFGASPASV
jgi:AcrR family transcriptional regulator